MRGKKRVLNEMKDATFIMNAAKNGDPAAAEIYQLISRINTEEIDLKTNFRLYNNAGRKEALDNLKGLKVMRDSLIHRYGLQSKKAKIYLDTLKRDRREERDASNN